MYGLFYETKCTLLEINPIAETVDGQSVVAEADLNYSEKYSWLFETKQL